MTTKTTKIRFFVPSTQQDSAFDLGDFLSRLAANDDKRSPAESHTNFFRQVRELEDVGHTIKGSFAKFRHSDIPHAGSPDGGERDIPLEDDEGLIEKNYFIYKKRENLLIFQQNGHANTPSVLGRYLSSIIGETISFDPVLQPGAADRLMRGEVSVRKFVASFARPTNPDRYPEDDWDSGLIEQLSQIGGANIALKITSDKRSNDEDRRRLRDRVKDAAVAFSDQEYATTVRLDVEENGVEHPIDLMADRIESPQDVEMDGRYPRKDSVYAALQQAYDQERETIREVLGDPEERIQ